jgi:hypothetical protein
MEALVITPVKDSVAIASRAAKAVMSSRVPVAYRIFDDYSTEESSRILTELAKDLNIQLTHLRTLADTPSPNYKTVLQSAQIEALNLGLPLIIVESDVIVKEDTFEELINFSKTHPEAGMAGAITVDDSGKVNFPYLKFKGEKKNALATERSLSFCCTLLSVNFLKKYDFQDLDQSKHWYDTHISKMSLQKGFRNFILPKVKVLHQPHGSRPWKKLKYENPIKYYWNKLFKGLDKI